MLRYISKAAKASAIFPNTEMEIRLLKAYLLLLAAADFPAKNKAAQIKTKSAMMQREK